MNVVPKLVSSIDWEVIHASWQSYIISEGEIIHFEEATGGV